MMETDLLKNVVGNNMKAQAGKEFSMEVKAVKNLPYLKNDVIRQRYDGKHEFPCTANPK
jgi:hypothetical protein